VTNILLSLVLWSGAQTAPPPRVVPEKESSTIPIYRQLKPGEQRVEAMLRRIDCPGGRPVVFTLQKDGKPIRFTAPSLTSVDFAAYTPTFRGPVTCGGRTPPDRVYLTWKKADGADRVIAVEFLPVK
jgi:hypothetical protein